MKAGDFTLHSSSFWRDCHVTAELLVLVAEFGVHAGQSRRAVSYFSSMSCWSMMCDAARRCTSLHTVPPRLRKLGFWRDVSSVLESSRVRVDLEEKQHFLDFSRFKNGVLLERHVNLSHLAAN